MCTYNYAEYIQNALTCEPFEKDLNQMKSLMRGILL